MVYKLCWEDVSCNKEGLLINCN